MQSLTSLDLSSNIKLEKLIISNTPLTSLDLSQNTALTYLDYSNCPQLSVLNLKKDNLLYLGCAGNNLTSLDLSAYPKLEGLNCSSNQLTSLDLSNNANLQNLDCYLNQLTSLDLSNNVNLKTLYCGITNGNGIIYGGNINRLSSLDLSQNTNLTELDCSGNLLTELNLSQNTKLEKLNCSSNQLTSLDLSGNTALISLSCGNIVINNNTVSPTTNKITSLDLSNNTQLQTLSCGYNQLTGLDLSSNTNLQYLDCSNNQLTSLDLSSLTQLRQLKCSSNRLASLDLSQNKALSSVEVNGQKISLAATLADGNYQVDLKEAAGENNLEKITLENQDIKYVPATGIAVLGEALMEFTYSFATGGSLYQNPISMIVNVLPVSDGAPASYVEINEQNFPDAAFRSYISQMLDTDHSGVLSKQELDSVTKIDFYGSGFYINTIASLKGIEYFTNLSVLNCRFNQQLTSLDLSQNTNLTELDCSLCNLSSLDLSNNTLLAKLVCSNSPLTTLDLSQNTALTYLDYSNCPQLSVLNLKKDNLLYLGCAGNNLTSLDLSAYPKLEGLNCSNNQLTSLDVSQFPQLVSLSCSSNQLTSLDVSSNTKLQSLSCGYNQLTSLDVSKNTALQQLECMSAQLSSLDLTNNTALTLLYCSGNRLTSLDLSNNTNLRELNCSYNQLSSLDLSNNTNLQSLYCGYNQLTSLDLSNNTNLQFVDCSYNQIINLEVSQNSLYMNLSAYQYFTVPARQVDGVWQADMNEILGDEKDSFTLYNSDGNYRYENGIIYLGSDINPKQIILQKVINSVPRPLTLVLYITAKMESENVIDLVELSDAVTTCFIGDQPAAATVPDSANYKIIREVWEESDSYSVAPGNVAYWYSDGNYPEGAKTFTEFKPGKTYRHYILLQANDGWTFADPNHYTIDENGNQKSDLTVEVNGVETVVYNASLYINTLNIPLSSGYAAYKITEGANSSWTQNSSSALRFKSNGDYEKLRYINVDAYTISPEYYDVESGSTVITLKKEFLDTLSAGEHTLSLTFTDGYAYTTFTIYPQSSSPSTHEHFFTWQYNTNLHWQICYECGTMLPPSSHQFIGNVCIICGYIAPYTQLASQETAGADIEIEIVDENGSPVPGLTLELRSLPRQATTSALGTVTFSGVEFGTHTISVLDSVGRIIASKSFNLISGNTLQINDTAITAAPGSKVSLSLVYSGGDLTIADADDSVLIDIPTEAKYAKDNVYVVK